MIDTDLLARGITCFESGGGLDVVRRRARETQAARYFWKGCGLDRSVERDGRTRLGSGWGGRVRPLMAGPGESGRP